MNRYEAFENVNKELAKEILQKQHINNVHINVYLRIVYEGAEIKDVCEEFGIKNNTVYSALAHCYSCLRVYLKHCGCELEPALSRNVLTLGLPRRISSALLRRRVFTIEQLINMKTQDLMMLRDIGVGSIETIDETLNAYGFQRVQED